MKLHYTRLSLIALGLSAAFPVAAQLGISRDPAFVPAANAMLDVSVASLANKLGMLIPRMTDAQRIAIAPNAAAEGLLVYQTNAPSGFWYWDGAAWVPFTAGDGWNLNGNTGTAPATEFVGTADNQNFRLRTNASIAVPPPGVVITAGATPGRVGVNTATTNEMLEVSGGILLNGGTAGATAGNLRGTPGVFPGTTVHQGYMGAPVNNWYQLENVFGERRNQVYQVVTAGCNYPIIAAPNPSFDPGPLVGSGGVGDWVTIGTGAAGVSSATIETPYATFWEDHKVQYLYRATELSAVIPNGSAVPISICPLPEVIEGLAFRTGAFAAAQANSNVEIKMANTTLTTLTTFAPGPLQLCYSSPAYVATANAWNVHQFSTPFGWNGTGNVIVEFCFDNNNWTSNTGVYFDATAYSGLYGSYCDACGSLFAPGTCYFASCPNNTPGPGGVLCTGYSHTPGCQHSAGMSLQTCDGTFQFTGAQGNANKHPQLRLYTKVGSIVFNNAMGDYIYTGNGVIVGGGPGYHLTGPSPYAFKGPGTIVAQNQVWGGGLLLMDHVFDSYYDGEVKPQDIGARDYVHRSIEEVEAFVRDNRHLPTIQGRKTWNEQGQFSVDGLNSQLWVTVEEQALHIKELNERMELLQKYLIEKRLAELKKK